MTRFQKREKNIDQIRENWDALSDAAKLVIETTDDDFTFEMFAGMTAEELNEYVKEEY